jgi:hypothetical protein
MVSLPPVYGSGTDIYITLAGIGTGALNLESFETDNLVVL